MNAPPSNPILLVLAAAIALFPGVSHSAESPTGNSRAIVRKASVTSSAALTIAEFALNAAIDKGVQVAGAVVDQGGVPLVVLRTDYGTEHVVTAATDKAWTALNFKRPTRAMLQAIQANQGDDGQLPHSQRALFLMGGVPLTDGDAVVGAVGVAGFPSGLDDDSVATQAAHKFQTILSAEATKSAR